MAKEFEFDPIKRDKGGKEAEAVIWSSSVLEKAVDAIKKGLPLKANPFIGKNTKLLKPDLVFKRTKEEIDDYMHCMEDPLYFATKCYLMTPTGLQPVILRNYQEDYIRHLQENRFSLFLSCRQSGKTNFFTTKSNFIFPKLLIDNYLKNNHSLIDNILEKYHFYIDKDNNYVIQNLPIYELQNLFDDSFIWKLKYNLYKMISWQENQKKKVKNMLNTIKKIFHHGQ